MILRPEINPKTSASRVVPAWEAVARAQTVKADKYQLVRQPDHARLSGELAKHLAIPGAPPVTGEIVQAISLHDEGWADFDSGRERLQATPARYTDTNVARNADGKPLCFLDIHARDFLRAWRDSIASAQEAAPLGGLMVSGHFYRLGTFGLSTGRYTGNDAQLIREFLEEEDRQCERLLPREKRSKQEVEYWTDVLQFCDLLSLYLCCGSEESVEFPQHIGPQRETITLRVVDGVNVLSPPSFAGEAEFSLEAFHDAGTGSLELKWIVR
jgi:hypothetical protein